MGPLLLKGWREAPVCGIALLVSFYLTIVLAQAGIVLLFSGARTLGPRIGQAMVGLSAAAQAGFGLFQLWTGAALLLTG